VVRAFHDASPVRAGPILRLDCALHERRLRAALQEWVMADDRGSGSQLLRQSAGGTLFLDGLGRLAPETQELLALFAQRPLGESPGTLHRPRACRLAAGSARGLVTRVREGSFSGALLDCLDKIRFQLRTPGRRWAA